MKKLFLLVGLALVSLHSKCQDENKWVSDPGGYNESDFFRHKSPQLIDAQSWLTSDKIFKGFYLEIRRGYEDSVSNSVFIGKKVELFSDNLEVTPMAGYVCGKVLNGLSLATTIETGDPFKCFYFESENEYFLSNNRPGQKNFFYDWSKVYRYLLDETNPDVGLGIGAQIQGVSQHLTWVGPMLRFKFCKLVAFDFFSYYNCLSTTLNDRWIYTFALDINDN